ncbi:MAG: cell division protein ZapA [Candidatus Aminicenantales bacterium]
MDKIIEIEIFRQKYKIRVKGDEDERYISLLTSYVDQKMHEVAVKSKSADLLKIAVLTALNIADDYFVTKRQLDEVKHVLSRLEREIGQVETLLNEHGTT